MMFISSGFFPLNIPIEKKKNTGKKKRMKFMAKKILWKVCVKKTCTYKHAHYLHITFIETEVAKIIGNAFYVCVM